MLGFDPIASAPLGSKRDDDEKILIESVSELSCSASVKYSGKSLTESNSDISIDAIVFPVVRGDPKTIEMNTDISTNPIVFPVVRGDPKTIEMNTDISSRLTGLANGAGTVEGEANIIALNRMESVGKASVNGESDATAKGIATPIVTGIPKTIDMNSSITSDARVVVIKEDSFTIETFSDVIIENVQVINYIISFPTFPSVATSNIEASGRGEFVAKNVELEIDSSLIVATQMEFNIGAEDIEANSNITVGSDIVQKLNPEPIEGISDASSAGEIVTIIRPKTVENTTDISSNALMEYSGNSTLNASSEIPTKAKADITSLQLEIAEESDISARMVRMVDGIPEDIVSFSNVISDAQKVVLIRPKKIVMNSSIPPAKALMRYAGNATVEGKADDSSLAKMEIVSLQLNVAEESDIFARMARVVDAKAKTIESSTDASAALQYVILLRPNTIVETSSIAPVNALMRYAGNATLNTGPFVNNVSGGEITTIVEDDIPYKIHTFNTSDVFRISVPETVTYFIVGGGGGGGAGAASNDNTRTLGGGGGAGGVVIGDISLTAGDYPVSIGQGGTRGTSSNLNAGNGGVSSFINIEALGGGGGAGSYVALANNGASGGGGAGGINPGSGGIGTQGNDGENGTGTSSGGGGGFISSGQGNQGGEGFNYLGNVYARGGNGATRLLRSSGASGAANTGMGGGGGSGGRVFLGNAPTFPFQPIFQNAIGNGGNGGSGIVILKYEDRGIPDAGFFARAAMNIKAQSILNTESNVSGRMVRMVDASSKDIANVTNIFGLLQYVILLRPKTITETSSTDPVNALMVYAGKSTIEVDDDINVKASMRIPGEVELESESDASSRLVRMITGFPEEIESDSEIDAAGQRVILIRPENVEAESEISSEALMEYSGKSIAEIESQIVTIGSVSFTTSIDFITQSSVDSRAVRVISGKAENIESLNDVEAKGQRVVLIRPKAIECSSETSSQAFMEYAGKALKVSASENIVVGKVRFVAKSKLEAFSDINSRAVRVVSGFPGDVEALSRDSAKGQRVVLIRPKTIESVCETSSQSTMTYAGKALKVAASHKIVVGKVRFVGEASFDVTSQIDSRGVRLVSGNPDPVEANSNASSKGQRVVLIRPKTIESYAETSSQAFMEYAGKALKVASSHKIVVGKVRFVWEASFDVTSQIDSRGVKLVSGNPDPVEANSNASSKGQRVVLIRPKTIESYAETSSQAFMEYAGKALKVASSHKIVVGKARLVGESLIDVDSDVYSRAVRVVKAIPEEIVSESNLMSRGQRIASGKAFINAETDLNSSSKVDRKGKSQLEAESNITLESRANYVGISTLNNESDVSARGVLLIEGIPNDISSDSNIECSAKVIKIGRADFNTNSDVQSRAQRVRLFEGKIDSNSDAFSRAQVIKIGRAEILKTSKIVSKSVADYRGYATQETVSVIEAKGSRFFRCSSTFVAISNAKAKGSTLLIEDGTGLPDAESYVSVLEALSYFNRFGGGETFLQSDEVARKRALRRATLIVDRLILWEGEKLTEDQAFEFPRIIG